MWWLEQLSIDPPVRSLAPVLGHLEVVKAAWPAAGGRKTKQELPGEEARCQALEKKKKKDIA